MSLSLTKLIFSPKPRTVITAPDVSRCVLLKNCFNPAEESGNAWVKELEDDVKFECEQKYGKVIAPLFDEIRLNGVGQPYPCRRRL